MIISAVAGDDAALTHKVWKKTHIIGGEMLILTEKDTWEQGKKNKDTESPQEERWARTWHRRLFHHLYVNENKAAPWQTFHLSIGAAGGKNKEDMTSNEMIEYNNKP